MILLSLEVKSIENLPAPFLPCKTSGQWPSTGQGESSYQNPTMLTPDLSLPTFRTLRNTFCMFCKPPSLWYFVLAAQAKTYFGPEKGVLV